MTPTDRRKRVTDVFQLAVQVPEEERRQFLQRECAGDNTLIREVESLLQDYQASYDSPRESRPQSAPAEPPSGPSPPMRRIGRFQVTKEIGSGGFGRVYSAIDPNFGRVVAIKVMSAPGDADLVKRFRVEATTVANLQHKNIVEVYEFGEQDGAPYLVMQYLDGTNLQDLINQNSLSLLEKIQIMSEVANGLQCAHERGITHRDVKPANIMRLANGDVKIMDFGIARIATENAKGLTQTGFIIGTLFYMSPEQFNGASADPQCDIFAFGVTFYELLTGKNPFAAPTTGETITRIMTVEPPPVASLVPGCPEGLDRIVKMTLAKNREMRYTSLSDVVLDARPIIMELQRGQAGQFFSKANQLFAAGQLDAAQAAVRKVLEFDPVHAAARQLRTQIEQALQRRDAASRAGTLLEKAEKELRERMLPEAAATLSIIRKLAPSDPYVKTRLEKAESLIEQARRAERLLETAREDLNNSNLTEAFRAVSEVLGQDPANNKGKELLQEVRAGMAQREAKRKLQEDLGRAEGLLLIGETEQALALVAEIEKHYPNSPEAWALRSRAEAQQAEETRRRRLTEGTVEAKALIRGGRFQEALTKIEQMLADFPSHAELKALHRHASERLAAERRALQIAELKKDAAGLIERREYDQAIRALEGGVARHGDDGELTRLLQSAIAGKAAEERDRAMNQVVDDANQLRQQAKVDEAQKVVERAIQIWGDGAPLGGLLKEISAERQERDRKRAIHEVLRKAGMLLEQKKLEAAVDLLRQSNAQNGEDAEISKLLQRVEAQLQSRERSLRISAIIEEMRKLAGARRWQEALDRAEEGLRNFPNEPALIAEREAVRGPLEKERRERAIAEALAKVRPMIADGRTDEAKTVLLDPKLIDLQEDTRLLDIQRRLAELAAQKEQEENIEKACAEAIALRSQDRFDDAIRLLDACSVRYPGSKEVAAALAEARKERDEFRLKKEISTALTRASELVQNGEIESGRYLLESLIKTYPDSRELTEAAARIQARMEDAEQQREIAQMTASIEQAIAQRQWSQALNRAAAAIEKYPRQSIFGALKRRAEEARYKAEIDDIVNAAMAAGNAGDLGRAAEIVAAGRKRWDKEKRLAKLADEIKEAQEADVERTCAEAIALGSQDRFDDAIRLLEACGERYPGSKLVANALAEARKGRDEFRCRKEISTALARASELVQKGDIESGRYLLESLIKTYPDSRELAEAAARLQTRLEDAEQQHEIDQMTAAIEQAIAQRQWSQAVNRAAAAIEKYPREPIFGALKRRADEGKYKAEIDDIVNAAMAARNSGDLARAAEIVADGRKRWDKEKRLAKLADEIKEAQEADIEKACAEAIALRSQDRFDDAIRLLDACGVRYPGSKALAAALADARKARDESRRKKEISTALARASELVQKGDVESGRYLLQDLIKTYPDSRELTEAVARLQSRLEDAEQQRDIAQMTAAIEQAIAQRQWSQAVNQAAAAIEKYPRESIFGALKRRADDGKYKADIDDIVNSATAARSTGDLGRAAEIVAAERKRWPKEKRLTKLADEIEEARADQGVAAAKALADAGNYAEANQKVGEVLARRAKYPPALELAQSIAARQAAREQDRQISTGLHKLPDPKPQPAPKPPILIIAGIAFVLVAGLGLFLATRPKPPAPQTQETAAKTGNTQPAGQQATPQQSATQQPAVVNPSTQTPLVAENKPPAPAKKDPALPKPTSPKPQDTKPVGTTPAAAQPPPPAPACTMASVPLSEYGGLTSGDLVWTGNAPGNELEIRGRQATPGGRVQGDVIPPKMPVRITPKTDGVTVSSGPSEANCWQAPLVLKSAGPMPSKVTVHWELF